jgi:hypothetical protein
LSIALDFISKLPRTKDPLTGISYDSILVIVDRLTKYTLDTILGVIQRRGPGIHIH